LPVKRTIKSGPCVEADLSDVTCSRQQFLPERNFVAALSDELRMKSQSCSDVAGLRRELLIPWPSFRRRRDGKGEDALALTPRHSFRVVGIKVEMAVEVD